MNFHVFIFPCILSEKIKLLICKHFHANQFRLSLSFFEQDKFFKGVRVILVEYSYFRLTSKMKQCTRTYTSLMWKVFQKCAPRLAAAAKTYTRHIATTLAILPPLVSVNWDLDSNSKYHSHISYPTKKLNVKLDVDVYAYEHRRYEHWFLKDKNKNSEDKVEPSMSVTYEKTGESKFQVESITLDMTKLFHFIDGKYSTTCTRTKNGAWGEKVHLEEDAQWLQEEDVMEFIKSKRNEFDALATDLGNKENKQVYYKASKTMEGKPVIVSMILPPGSAPVIQPRASADLFRMQRAHVLWIEDLDGVPELGAKSFVYRYANSAYTVAGITIPDGFDRSSNRNSQGVNSHLTKKSCMQWFL